MPTKNGFILADSCVRDCSGSFWRGEHRAKTTRGKPDPFWV